MRNTRPSGALTTTGRRWDTNSVSHFLRHPRNAGLRSHFVTGTSTRGTLTDDIVGPGTWPALVEESVWRAAQSVLAGRPSGGRGRRRSVRKHVLTGVLRCGREDGDLNLVRSILPDLGRWFSQHAQTMDAMLTWHLGQIGFNPDTGEFTLPPAQETAQASSCGGGAA